MEKCRLFGKNCWQGCHNYISRVQRNIWRTKASFKKLLFIFLGYRSDSLRLLLNIFRRGFQSRILQRYLNISRKFFFQNKLFLINIAQQANFFSLLGGMVSAWLAKVPSTSPEKHFTLSDMELKVFGILSRVFSWSSQNCFPGNKKTS